MFDRPIDGEQVQLFPAEGPVVSKDTTFRLAQLEVFNWGPFQGLHRAEFDKDATAIIGPTGSGKTTLVDALMTLLVATPRYNLASTGGHESDRTLVSYVRGVLGGDGSDGREEVARPGKTITGICATYRSHSGSGGGEEILRLAGLLWTEGPSSSTSDLKRRWIFSQADDQSLELWLRQLHDEGIRELMRRGRETAKLRIMDSKKAYLTHVRKFFDVGENAFTLLNRAAGLKQLNSIDEIFRDLVLDDRSAFERALEVAGEFDNLAAIHAELETARRQQVSLVPVAEEHKKLLRTRSKAERLRTLKRLVPIWFGIIGRQKWARLLERMSLDHESLQSQLYLKEGEEKACVSRVDTFRERYLELGGSAISELEKTIEMQQDRVSDRATKALQYQQMVRRFELSDELSRESLTRNQAQLRNSREAIQDQRDRCDEETLAARSQLRDETANRDEIASTLRKVKDRPGSNIPLRFQEFRADLAAQLALPEGDLPFLAELVEVQPEESEWRGAIERAIGSERLRVLVPEQDLEAALRWVNHRDNRLHVRLQGARTSEQRVEFFADGYLRKLNFKQHRLLGAAKRLLAGRDLHCVASPDQLKTVEHALTKEGMMSGRHGKFEKQDQKRLDQDWMTGFDNKDQLESLASQKVSVEQAVNQWQAEVQKHQLALSELNQRLTTLDALLELEFSTIDRPTAEAELEQSRQRLAALQAPDSDAAKARAAYEAEREAWESLQKDMREIESKLAVLDDNRKRVESEIRKAELRIGGGLSDEETQLAEKELKISDEVDPKDLSDAERDTRESVDKRLHEQLERVADCEKRLVRFMDAARGVDTGALTDTGSDIEDIPHYLERLRVLNEEALPEKRQRFLEYLNRSSDQGVTQLLAGIDEEVDAIEQRIKELNQTLVKVDFRSGRYLQLEPQRINDERLRSLQTAMRKVRSAALKDDEGESHYKALRELVAILREAGDNRRQLGSRALLDPRYRLQFFVVEVDRQTGNQSPRRTGSQSGSGGEKELMASHILTASLSYALCPAEASRPLYGTVVLDEAFSKSSPSAASRIIEALRIFCLHPIFVTPNKEIGLLKQHTRKVICVQRTGKDASLASISWEILEELAKPK